MDFQTIDRHIISIKEFALGWRFTDKKYDLLPEDHLQQMRPLDKDASLFLANFIDKTNLHQHVPFKKDFFRTTDKAKILQNNEKEIKKWLYHRGLPFSKTVFLSWDNEKSMMTTWKFVVKYWEILAYGGSDDLTVFDSSLEWGLLFFHEGEIYWGTNKSFVPTDSFDEQWFTF